MLGEALKQLRLFHGVKQKDLAMRLDVSQSYLSELESGSKKNVPLSLLEKYEEIFGIKPSYLLLFSEEMQEGSDKIRINRNAAQKILRIMRWISDKKGFLHETREETV